MFISLGNIIILITLACLLAPMAVCFCVFYPFSKKICTVLADYVLRVIVPRLFAILKVYKHFRLTFFDDMLSDLPEQFIVISNHQSLLDIPIYMMFLKGRDVRFVAKDSLSRNVPVVSPMLKTHEHCFIPRVGAPSVVMGRLEAFSKKCLKNKWIPIIFPEGTRSRDGHVMKFYSAGFRKIADATRLPVVACVVDEGYKINDVLHVMENMDKVNYHVKVLKIFPSATTKEEQVRVLDEAKELMEKQLDEWRGKS